LRVPDDPPRFFTRLRAEFALCGSAGRPSFVPKIYCSTKDAALNTTVHPTQRRLLIALVVTLACLPLLMLDVIQGSASSGATESSSSDSSLVVSAVPSTEVTTSTTVAATIPAAVAAPAPSTTAAPVAKVAPRAVAPTTTAPRPATTVAPVVQSEAAFLACVRERESHGDYSASDPTGTFLGAYQIYQGGWDSTASRIGRHDLVGVPPNQASPVDQDTIATAIYRVSGRAPWGGICG
jgi:hypothetical protein